MLRTRKRYAETAHFLPVLFHKDVVVVGSGRARCREPASFLLLFFLSFFSFSSPSPSVTGRRRDQTGDFASPSFCASTTSHRPSTPPPQPPSHTPRSSLRAEQIGVVRRGR